MQDFPTGCLLKLENCMIFHKILHCKSEFQLQIRFFLWVVKKFEIVVVLVWTRDGVFIDTVTMYGKCLDTKGGDFRNNQKIFYSWQL